MPRCLPFLFRKSISRIRRDGIVSFDQSECSLLLWAFSALFAVKSKTARISGNSEVPITQCDESNRKGNGDGKKKIRQEKGKDTSSKGQKPPKPGSHSKGTLRRFIRGIIDALFLGWLGGIIRCGDR